MTGTSTHRASGPLRTGSVGVLRVSGLRATASTWRFPRSAKKVSDLVSSLSAVTAAHSDLADFMRGETALVYARWRHDPEADPYFLVDGTAVDPEVKALAPRLECLMPECEDRRLQIVNRHSGPSGYRDGFRHGRGVGKHTLESIFHVQAKATLVRWVAGLNLDVTVHAEGWSPSHERRADVMVAWRDGRRVAFEVQHSPLSVPEWMKRHQSYRDQGIVDVWLFANTRNHLKEVPSGADDEKVSIRFSELFRACARDGVPALFINPVDALIGSTFVEQIRAGQTFMLAPGPSAEAAHLGFDALADCTLAPDGLISPTLARLTEQLPSSEPSTPVRARPGMGTGSRRIDPGRYRRATPSGPAADKTRCARCGAPLPEWQRGGACPEFGCWPHEPDCLFAHPDRTAPAFEDLLDPTYGAKACPVCAAGM